MEFSVMRGEIEAAVDGDDTRIAELAWDLRSVLRAQQSHTDRNDMVARILTFWDLDMSWMNVWQQRFDQAIKGGSDEELAAWLAQGAPEVQEQPPGLADPQSVAC